MKKGPRNLRGPFVFYLPHEIFGASVALSKRSGISAAFAIARARHPDGTTASIGTDKKILAVARVHSGTRSLGQTRIIATWRTSSASAGRVGKYQLPMIDNRNAAKISLDPRLRGLLACDFCITDLHPFAATCRRAELVT